MNNPQSQRAKSKNIIFDIGGVLFHYEAYSAPVYDEAGTMITSHNTYTPIEHGIKLLKQCYDVLDEQGDRLHRLYILSNWGTTPFDELSQQFSTIFNLFDGSVISGMLEIKKPDTRIYEHLLKIYNLNPEDCIFIDDSYENVQAAERIGITSIECQNHEHVEMKLKKLGIIS